MFLWVKDHRYSNINWPDIEWHLSVLHFMKWSISDHYTKRDSEWFMASPCHLLLLWKYFSEPAQHLIHEKAARCKHTGQNDPAAQSYLCSSQQQTPNTGHSAPGSFPCPNAGGSPHCFATLLGSPRHLCHSNFPKARVCVSEISKVEENGPLVWKI